MTPHPTARHTGQTHLYNGRIVLKEQVISGAVLVRDERITAVDSAAHLPEPGGVDLDGDYLLPGLVELHTDYLETYLQPRPGVVWPHAVSALGAHDAQLVGAGITTVLDSVCVGEPMQGAHRAELLAVTVEAMEKAKKADILKAEHHLHLRCEISDPAVVAQLAPRLNSEMLRLVSVMDHTPGQRQWTDLEKFRQYHQRRNWTEEVFTALLQERYARHEKYAESNRRTIVNLCRERNIPLASHDDTTPEHVLEAKKEGAVISEFPTTLDAAREARSQGLAVVMGAPNVVRGGSHSGNAAVSDLVKERLVDALSSDYLPMSQLCGAFQLHEQHNAPLHEAVAMVTANPANAVGFADRGEITPGKRADLVRVRLVEGVPVVRGVWRQGKQVLS